MNRERMLGVFQNLLTELQEDGIINKDGNNKIMRALLNNMREAQENERRRQ